MRRERSEPIFPARDLVETRAFYEKLGFKPWFGERGGQGYEIVWRGHLVVHFFAEPGLRPDASEASCYWRVPDADQLHREFAGLDLPAQGIPRLTRPEDRPWGMREFTLVDPSGNLVRIGHELGDVDFSQEPERPSE
jgi:catechol 2,3-dioxygenase-like lactoylglutathione lyase family enzyme